MEKPVFQFTEAKRKRQSAPCNTAPFPIPIESITGSPLCRWNFYSGQLIGSSVHIASQSDMTLLYEMGFFGKGNLSWSGPEHNITKHDAENSTRKHCRLTSRRTYLQHCRWAAASSSNPSPVFATDDDHLPYPKKMPAAAEIVPTELRPQVPIPVDVPEEKTALPFPAYEDQPADIANSEEDDDLDDDPWARTAEEETKAFWGTSSQKSASASVDISSQLAANSAEIDSSESRWLPHSKMTVVAADTSTDVNDSSIVADSTVYCMQATDNCETDKLSTDGIKNVCTTTDFEECRQTDVVIDTESSCNNRVRGICRTVDSRCEENDADADILVVDDTDDSDVDDNARISRPQWRVVRKKDPFPLTEHLQLSLEEAFFLSYGLGCLAVTDAEKVTLNLTDMWQRFCRISPRFVERYVVYHNLRSKGWVPKPGLKFGVDFVLYKRGPPFYHASYSVIVNQVRDDDLEPVLSTSGSTSWTSLSCLNRITEQVSKELMMCHVIRPSELTDEDLSSPLCISKFKVMEVVVRRWVSKRERENAEFLLIP